jgi:predicted GNAT family N-acyltransferase
VFEEHVLDPVLHDRKNFTCGVAALDVYLRQFAVQQSKKGVAVVRVLVDKNNPKEILGYYSLSAAQIGVSTLSELDRKALPRYPVPCFRMGRLACSETHRGKGLGRLLIGCAVERCIEASKLIGAFALLVDAKDSAAKSFYEHYGFTACADSPLTLYLPLGG